MRRFISNPLTSLALLALLGATGCATNKPQGAAPAAPAAQATPAPAAAQQTAATPGKPAGKIVKSRNGKFDGEVFGEPVANSKFAKLQIGMEMSEVQDLMGRSPDRTHSHETGKRWIPFYFGSDARRLQAWYKGEGCLAFTGGNAWGGGGGELVSITHDASGACYQP